MAYEAEPDWIEEPKRSSLPVSPIRPEISQQEALNCDAIVARCFIELGLRLEDVHLDEIRPIRPMTMRGRATGFSVGFRGSYVRVVDAGGIPNPDLLDVPDLIDRLLRMEWISTS